MMVLVAVAVGAGWLYSVRGDTDRRRGGVLRGRRGGADNLCAAGTLVSRCGPRRPTRAIRTCWVGPADGGGAATGADGGAHRRVMVGDLLPDTAGCKVPVDGTVVGNNSEVDESMVTGEPAVSKARGQRHRGVDQHHRGAAGACRKVGSDTALAQIVAMVQGRRTPGPRPAAGRPRRVLAGAGRPHRRDGDVPGDVSGRWAPGCSEPRCCSPSPWW